MGRTRDGLLDGAYAALVRSGARAATMSEIATLGGVAKATLYNHFRTKADVWTALAVREVERIGTDAAQTAATDLAAALAGAAVAVGEHPVVRRLASAELESLAELTVPLGPAWVAAADQVRRLLGRAGRADGPAETGLVLRWLASRLTAPDDARSATAEARLLDAALPTR